MSHGREISISCGSNSEAFRGTTPIISAGGQARVIRSAAQPSDRDQERVAGAVAKPQARAHSLPRPARLLRRAVVQESRLFRGFSPGAKLRCYPPALPLTD